MTSIFDIIQKMHEKLLSYEGYQRAWIEKNWEQIVGSVAKRHCHPRIIRDKILYISVDSSTWNQSLFMEKRRMIEKINSYLKQQFVIDLKFQIGDDGNNISISDSDRKKGPHEEGTIRKDTTDLLVLKALQKKEEEYQKRNLIPEKEK